MSNKFEQLLELLINEETDKAEALFHEIVVEKSRDIYEGLADETTTETKEESKVEETEASKDEAVKETESSEESEEKATEGEDVEVAIEDEKAEEEKTEEAETKEEESIEEVGGDATDELVKDIAADETGEAEHAADDMEKDMDAGAEDGDTEERVEDLEDALDELKAEFEKMMAGKGDEMDKDEEEKEESLEPQADVQAEVSVESKTTEAMHGKKDMKKEAVKEYKIAKSGDNADKSDTKDSPVATKGGADMGANGKNIAQGGEEQGRAAPNAEKMGSFENSPGKDKGTSFKKAMKPNTADGSDKSGKSAIAGK